MAKKVLLAEKSPAIRNIAESLLRQGGYEVLSAENIESAREILKDSKIDLLLISSDLDDSGGVKFYDVLGSDSATAMIPLLVLHDQAAGSLAYPPEATINKPFTPREFIETVTAFSGGAGQIETASQTPFEGGDLEDDIIDAALGLDKLEVDNAEVMGNDTGVFRRANKKDINESMVGYDFKAPSDDSTITKRKEPEQINIPAETASPEAKAPTPTAGADQGKSKETADFLGADSAQMRRRPVNGMTASSKIEIVTDQYGLTDESSIPAPAVEPDKKKNGHDYSWFLKEMRESGVSPDSPPSDKTGSDSLQISTTSEGLNPVAPPPKSVIRPEVNPVVEKSSPEGVTHNEAVDKFINEFKEEMQKISDEPVSEVSVPGRAANEPGRAGSGKSLAWEEAIEKITPAEMQAISQKIVDMVIGQVSERIKEVLTPETVTRIMERCINESLKKIRENKSGN